MEEEMRQSIRWEEQTWWTIVKLMKDGNIFPCILFFKVKPITFYLYTGGNNVVERETLELQEGKEDERRQDRWLLVTWETLCALQREAGRRRMARRQVCGFDFREIGVRKWSQRMFDHFCFLGEEWGAAHAGRSRRDGVSRTAWRLGRLLV